MLRITNNTLYYKIIKVCISLIFITSSFDVFLTFNVSGFTLRFCQIVCLFIFILWALDIATKKIRIPVGRTPLLIWVTTQLLFCFRSPNLLNALGYFAWLIFDVLIIFVISQYIGRAFDLNWLIKMYMRSFVWISFFGLAQFALYPLGINMFVAQVWNSNLARINGFCYEPSYYSTYLLPGFVIYAYLYEKKSTDIFSLKEIKWNLAIITLALVLSTSRMGWLMMGVYIIVRLLYNFFLFARKGIKRKSMKKVIFLSAVLALLIPLIIRIISNMDLLFLLNGLGIAGTAAHSSKARIECLQNCINIFKENPLLGYSLGGVDPMLARSAGRTYIAGENGAGNVLGELLVANGVVGLIPFVWYFYTILFGNFRKLRLRSNTYSAVRTALIFEFIILCMNQNILRVYFWCLLAVLNALEITIKKEI